MIFPDRVLGMSGTIQRRRASYSRSVNDFGVLACPVAAAREKRKSLVILAGTK